jgi:hypothetical protein
MILRKLGNAVTGANVINLFSSVIKFFLKAIACHWQAGKSLQGTSTQAYYENLYITDKKVL